MMFGRMRIAMSCVVMAVAMMVSLKPAMAGAYPEKGKSRAYTATVKVMKDDAPDHVKAYFAAEHEAAKQAMSEYLVQCLAIRSSLKRLEVAKVDPDETDPSLIVDEKVVASERIRQRRMQALNRILNAIQTKIEEMENPNGMKDVPLLDIDTTELKVGQIGSVPRFQLVQINGDGDAVGVVSLSESDEQDLSREPAEPGVPPRLPVIVRGVSVKAGETMESLIGGKVFQVTEIVDVNGQKYPVLEPFDLKPYLKEIPIEAYEKLNGTRIQWPSNAMSLSPERLANQAATQPATQPTTQP